MGSMFRTRYVLLAGPLLVLVGLAPRVAHAASTLSAVIDALAGALGAFVSVGVGIALLVFVWGIVQFVLQAGNETQMIEGRKRMLWGVIALFVIVSIWGLVTILQSMVGAGGTQKCSSPKVDANGTITVNCS